MRKRCAPIRRAIRIREITPSPGGREVLDQQRADAPHSAHHAPDRTGQKVAAPMTPGLDDGALRPPQRVIAVGIAPLALGSAYPGGVLRMRAGGVLRKTHAPTPLKRFPFA